MVSTRRNPIRSGIENRASTSLRSAASSSKPKRRGAGRPDGVPDVYRDMLVEAGAVPARRSSDIIKPSPKRLKRPGEKIERPAPGQESPQSLASDDAESDEENIEFEDVELPAPVIQTVDYDSEDDDDDDVLLEEVEMNPANPTATLNDEESKDLELNLTAQQAATPTRKAAERRKPLNKADKERRVEIHKKHLLCLLAHVARRNHWCNDEVVQETLRSLLTEKIITCLNPRPSLNQFGRTESLKTGLQLISSMFKAKFNVTERGMWRALWAEDPEHLKDYQFPSDLESTLDKSDFRKAAKSLRGSRDVGAQLFCALLRAAGVETRLVCSLQPLPFGPGVPTLPKPKPSKGLQKKAAAQIPSVYRVAAESAAAPTAASPPRRRLGHPNAAAYHIPIMPAPTPPSPSSRGDSPRPKSSRPESAFPIYWVEILDEAHQKWQPVDPLVTASQWRPSRLEPPASDRDNNLVYAMAFESDGAARDVTRRYARAYTSKTRRNRVDGLPDAMAHSVASAAPIAGRPTALSGARWLRRALRPYTRPGAASDVDDIEAAELAAAEAREPMPRKVADFRDHPVYALQRHLRRHEVLLPSATSVGTVAPGPGRALERIYRRADVRVARNAERWYRLGRVVRGDSTPVRWIPKQQRLRMKGRFDDNDEEDDDDDDDEEDPVLGTSSAAGGGTPIFTLEQTTAYSAPPVRDGVVPKNRFGNVDVYVPSMVPAGGTHVLDDRAARAAFLLGVDYAPALTGFSFSGRRGTAVLAGAVVPAEAEEAVLAVVEALGDLEADEERERRARAAVRMWSRMLKGLRIRERIWAAAEERGEDVGADDAEDENDGGFEKGEGAAGEEHSDLEMDGADVESATTEEFDMVMDDDDDGGGGFLVE